MDATDETALDYLSMTEVEYYYKGKLLVTVLSWVYPNYREGDHLSIDTQPTKRDKMRRPKQEFVRGYFAIKKILHVVQEPKDGIFTTKLEVLLEDPPDIPEDEIIDRFRPQIDTNDAQPSIPRRLLHRG
jgi:hypothetical protein